MYNNYIRRDWVLGQTDTFIKTGLISLYRRVRNKNKIKSDNNNNVYRPKGQKRCFHRTRALFPNTDSGNVHFSSSLIRFILLHKIGSYVYTLYTKRHLARRAHRVACVFLHSVGFFNSNTPVVDLRFYTHIRLSNEVVARYDI